jgi:hypothetical protein
MQSYEKQKKSCRPITTIHSNIPFIPNNSNNTMMLNSPALSVSSRTRGNDRRQRGRNTSKERTVKEKTRTYAVAKQQHKTKSRKKVLVELKAPPTTAAAALTSTGRGTRATNKSDDDDSPRQKRNQRNNELLLTPTSVVTERRTSSRCARMPNTPDYSERNANSDDDNGKAGEKSDELHHLEQLSEDDGDEYKHTHTSDDDSTTTSAANQRRLAEEIIKKSNDRRSRKKQVMPVADIMVDGELKSPNSKVGDTQLSNLMLDYVKDCQDNGMMDNKEEINEYYKVMTRKYMWKQFKIVSEHGFRYKQKFVQYFCTKLNKDHKLAETRKWWDEYEALVKHTMMDCRAVTTQSMKRRFLGKIVDCCLNDTHYSIN